MADDPTLHILTPKDRGGRPRVLTAPGRAVTTWVEAPLHDELIRRAQQRPDGSVSAAMRDLLRKATGR